MNDKTDVVQIKLYKYFNSSVPITVKAFQARFDYNCI
jgi:hypothetical protein